jgi:hypothetical protein
MHSGNPGCVGVRMRWCCANTTLSVGTEAAPEFILRRGEYTRRAHDAGGMHGRNLTSVLMRSRVPNRTRDRGGKPIQLGDSSHEHGPRSGA